MKLESVTQAAKNILKCVVPGFSWSQILSDAEAFVRSRDESLVALCADKLDERGHHHAANSLRKMAREGEIF